MDHELFHALPQSQLSRPEVPFW